MMGRPRKICDRQPNGQPRRRKKETDWGVIEPVLRRRCAELGLRPTVDNMRKMRGQEAGTPWGRLWLDGEKISRREYEAAAWYAIARVHYLRAIDAPKETAPCSSYGGSFGGRSNHDDPEWARKARLAFDRADGVLMRMGRQYKRAVVDMFAEQAVPLAPLRRALRALADEVL